jgi:hypothetical protein
MANFQFPLGASEGTFQTITTRPVFVVYMAGKLEDLCFVVTTSRQFARAFDEIRTVSFRPLTPTAMLTGDLRAPLANATPTGATSSAAAPTSPRTAGQTRRLVPCRFSKIITRPFALSSTPPERLMLHGKAYVLDRVGRLPAPKINVSWRGVLALLADSS